MSLQWGGAPSGWWGLGSVSGSSGSGGSGSITGGGNFGREPGADGVVEMEVKSPCLKDLQTEIDETNGWNKWTCIAVNITKRDM